MDIRDNATNAATSPIRASPSGMAVESWAPPGRASYRNAALSRFHGGLAAPPGGSLNCRTAMLIYCRTLEAASHGYDLSEVRL